jgi:hypothetical protein
MEEDPQPLSSHEFSNVAEEDRKSMKSTSHKSKKAK